MSTSNFKLDDPFQVENSREKYAKNKNKKMFLDLYEGKNSKVKNLNSKQQWDKMLVNEKESLSPMTLDRIKKTSNLATKYLNYNNTKTQKIFDIGIGNGYVELQIKKNCKGKVEFFGLDIAEGNLEIIKSQLLNFEGFVASVEKFDINKYKFKNAFDLVLALEVLEHIDADQVFEVYKKIYLLLSHKGHLIISVPINENLEEKIKNKTNFSAHVRRYTPEIIKYELELAGFKIINELKLYAFSRHYKIKSLIATTFSVGNPNLIILECVKQ